ncbi:MAG: hypothetical protein H6822_31345 [Planctomycetaceae bacterium]|nr:hypothetical protein [Planctomycetales bacterium]MCB9926676.1 hypothetical protein [Planctomycetaceae bacterium]
MIHASPKTAAKTLTADSRYLYFAIRDLGFGATNIDLRDVVTASASPNTYCCRNATDQKV